MAKPTIVSARSRYLILVLLKSQSPFLPAFLGRSGYAVSEAHSPDHLVALCLSNPVNAVIIDTARLEEIEGWSVAQSIKMVKPSLPVILFGRGATSEIALPTAVDAAVSDSDLPELLAILDKYITQKAAASG